VGGGIEFPVAPAHRAPVIHCGRFHAAHRGGRCLEVRKLFDRSGDHLFEGFDFKIGQIVIRPFDFKTETGRKILFVADHHIDVFSDLAVDLLTFLQSAEAFPERRTVVQVVRDHRAVFLGGFGRFNHQRTGGFRQRGKNPAGVQPTHAEFPKNVFPVDIADFEL